MDSAVKYFNYTERTVSSGQVPPSTLFRAAVIEERQSQWLGRIRISRPLSLPCIAAAALTLGTALLLFAAKGEICRKVTVHGVLLPSGGLVNVSSQQAGVVTELLVHEGDDVAEGQSLVRIKSERITAGGVNAGALNAHAIALRRESLTTERRVTEQALAQRIDSLRQRLQSLLSEERQALAELETHRLRSQLAQQTLERQQQLAKDGFVAAAQVQQKQEELLDLQLRERNTDRSLQALRRDVQGLDGERLAYEAQVRATLAQLDRSLATLDQEAAETLGRHGLILAAPRAGRVTAITVEVGQNAQPGQTIVSLAPSTGGDLGQAALQAQLYGPSRVAGFVRPGQQVLLRYASFPYQKFGMGQGTVLSVSRSPIAPADLPAGQGQALLEASRSNESLYRITVQLKSQSITTYGRQTPLSAGMALEASVMQDSRRIWEWLFESVLAVSGRF